MLTSHSVAIATAAILGVGAVQAGSAYFSRDPGLRIESRWAISSIVQPGQDLQIHFKADRTRQCDYEFRRSIYDSADTRWQFGPVIIDRTTPPSTDESLSTVRVPVGAANGPARYRVAVHASCNVLQNVWPIEYNLPDINFIIGKDTRHG